MKPGLKEILGVKRIRNQCLDEHVSGLYKTGYVPHAGVHNNFLNIGGYYSKDPLYNNIKPLYNHDRSYFYVLNDPKFKLISDNIKNPILRKLVDSYAEYDLIRYINSIKNNYYGSENEINIYIKICDESHIYLNKLNYILNELNNELSYENKLTIFKNHKNDLEKINIYKEYEFNNIIETYNKIINIINNF